VEALENLRQQQASALAYFDVFWLLAAVMPIARQSTELPALAHLLRIKLGFS
jgi:hypothetical protein